MTAKQPTNLSSETPPPELPVTGADALAHLRLLAQKVDAFFTRVEQQHADHMACRTGCNDCCHVRLTITSVEAEAIRHHWPQLPEEVRATLRAHAQGPSDSLCVALQDDGRCGIYEMRPLVCRSHGLPLRLRQDKRLPIIDACFRNFVETGPGAVAPDCVLDQQTLSTALLAIDAAFARAEGRPAGERVELAALLASLP
ncbi:MAG: YkgJ family cysteine cluster protein [Myxococcales bacterium]|nr:YkgJ family cysteine cluster protein [Myxococcales bacterium]